MFLLFHMEKYQHFIARLTFYNYDKFRKKLRIFRRNIACNNTDE